MSHTYDKDNDKYMDAAHLKADETDDIKKARRLVTEARQLEAESNIQKINAAREAAITAARNTAAIRLKAVRDGQRERASEREVEDEEKYEDEDLDLDLHQNQDPNGDDDDFGLGYRKKSKKRKSIWSME